MERFRQTYIRSDFEGWNGDSIYELDDGTKWELTAYTYSYSYSYRPRATLWRDGGRYFLEVANMREMKEVRRVY